MTALYASGDFTAVRVIDHWLEYPFSDFDDTTTKVYYLRCMINAADYETRARGNTMANASSAGVIALPITNGAARFCHDTALSSSSGGTIQFTRVFAMIPLNRTDYSTGLYTTPPVFDSKVEPILFTTDGFTSTPIRTRRTEYIKTPSESVVVPVKLRYSYTTSPSSVNTLTRESFEINKPDSQTYAATYQGNPVTEVNDGISVVTELGDTGVIEGTQIRQWMGDIYEVVTGYRI